MRGDGMKKIILLLLVAMLALGLTTDSWAKGAKELQIGFADKLKILFENNIRPPQYFLVLPSIHKDANLAFLILCFHYYSYKLDNVCQITI